MTVKKWDCQLTDNILFGQSLLFSHIGFVGEGKSKEITLQVWTGPEVSRRLRLSDFKTIDS